MYDANWTYGIHIRMRMPVLDVQMWPSGDVPGLGLTDGDIGILGGVDCDIVP
jgi:hypothetical protein